MTKKQSSVKKSRKKRRTVKKTPLKIKPSTIAIYILVFINSVLIISSAHKLFHKSKDVIIKNTPLRIEVQNGCGVTGLATKISSQLAYLNYQVIEKGNADHFNYENTIIVDLGSGDERAIEELRKDIGIPKDDIYLLREEANVDVRMIIGKDYESLKIYNSLP